MHYADRQAVRLGSSKLTTFRRFHALTLSIHRHDPAAAAAAGQRRATGRTVAGQRPSAAGCVSFYAGSHVERRSFARAIGISAFLAHISVAISNYLCFNILYYIIYVCQTCNGARIALIQQVLVSSSLASGISINMAVLLLMRWRQCRAMAVIPAT